MGLGGAGGSKTLAWGFAMAPHRLRILVIIIVSVLFEIGILKLVCGFIMGG